MGDTAHTARVPSASPEYCYKKMCSINQERDSRLLKRWWRGTQGYADRRACLRALPHGQVGVHYSTPQQQQICDARAAAGALRNPVNDGFGHGRNVGGGQNAEVAADSPCSRFARRDCVQRLAHTNECRHG